MFVKTIRKSSLQTGALLFVILGAGAALLTWPQAAAAGVSRGLSICSTVVIPSLFPFLVLAGFLIRSGVSNALGRRLERPVRFLFGLPGCCAAGILVGFVGGYPAGGTAVGELVRRGDITRAEGRRMLRFCVNGGPAFVISAVGAGMLGDVRYGALLFAAHIFAALLIGLAGRLFDRDKGREADTQPQTAGDKMGAAAAFVESVNAACRSLLYMCGFVVLFAALLAVSDGSGLTETVNRFIAAPFSLTDADTSGLACLFPCLLEVSCGCVDAAGTGAAAPLLLGMAMGWGGLSVHCQLAAILHGQQLMGKGFFAARAVHAMLGGLLSVMLFRWAPIAITTFSPSSDAVLVPYTTSATASVALLIMCAMLLFVTAGRFPRRSGDD